MFCDKNILKYIISSPFIDVSRIREINIYFEIFVLDLFFLGFYLFVCISRSAALSVRKIRRLTNVYTARLF